jgi:hypothetical protein
MTPCPDCGAPLIASAVDPHWFCAAAACNFVGMPEPEPLLDVIARLSFRPARATTRWGHPQDPHEYTIRWKADDAADWVALFEAIGERGVIERYAKGRAKPRRYLYPGDGWRYWHMAANLDGPPHPTDNWIINRNTVEEAERLRGLGIIS